MNKIIEMNIFYIFFYLSLWGLADGHLVDGIFTEPTLEPGYNLVATIPSGATNLNITELRHANNYLAVRLQDGSFLLNGNYSINWSGVYKAVGTSFVYHRQASQQLESIAAAGPIQQSIDIMVLYQEPNPGIVYRYFISGGTKEPSDNSGQGKRIDPTLMTTDELPSPPSSKRIKKRKFTWRSSGFTVCSKTCGGGVKSKSWICVREHNQAQVTSKRCHGLEKPADVPVRCNVGPCPPRWRAGSWSTCSVTCGSGIRSRDIECVQDVNSQLTVRISDGACTESKSPPVTEICEMPICKNLFNSTELISSSFSQWNTGEWSECSATCGSSGIKKRTVNCIPAGQSCQVDDKPSDSESCDLPPCPSHHKNSIDAQKTQWLHTEWTRDCSSECGTGHQTRSVMCDKKSLDETCDVNSRPESMRTCSSDRACSGQWFIGPWTGCSSSCDLGEQTREIICMTTIRGSLRVVLDMNCPADKPETRKSCSGPPCPAMWYTSDWTECTKSCDTGLQTRHVKCVRPGGENDARENAECRHDDRPIGRRVCNEYPCKHPLDDKKKSKQIINDPEIIEGLPADESCRDTMANCGLVIQARLCSYQFYEKVCCHSCSRVKLNSE